MFIYTITNKSSMKKYVGMTKRTIERRLKAHFYEAQVRKYNMYLHNAIRKHGTEFFTIDILEECTPESAPERERFWIRQLGTLQPNGYNEHEGGKGGCLNASPELRKKLSDAKKGSIPWNKGLNKTDPRVAACGVGCSLALKGRPKSEAHKRAMQEAKRKKVGDSVSRLPRAQ